MPNAPRRPCPTCHRLVLGPCQSCRRRRDHARGGATARGYDRVWAEVSRAWLRQHPWCGERADGLLYVEHSRCAAAGLRRRAQVTDHIQALRDGGARLDSQNFQSLCVSCNTAKGRIPNGREAAKPADFRGGGAVKISGPSTRETPSPASSFDREILKGGRRL